MYLSCLLIDTGENPDRPRPGRLWLRNHYRVHQRLCMAFPSAVQKEKDPRFLKPFHLDGFSHVHAPRTAEQSFLFRIDPQPGGRAVILVQSGIKPDWDYAFHNADYLLAAPPNPQEFNPAFVHGQALYFRLRANPTIKRDGKRIGILREQDQIDWLNRKAKEGGFEIVSLTTVPEGIAHDKMTDQSDSPHNLSLFSVRFEGILKVTDSHIFRQTLERGIGSAKGLGFGLLSIAPLREG